MAVPHASSEDVVPVVPIFNAPRSWVVLGARFGYLMKGSVFCLIGLLAGRTALRIRGQAADPNGAFRQLASEPFGIIVLALVAFGLVCYAVWEFVRAGVDADNHGRKLVGIAVRGCFFCSGVIHLLLAVTAVRVLVGSDKGDDPLRLWTERLIGLPFGRWLIAAIGLGFIGFCLNQFLQAYRGHFISYFRVKQMSRLERWSVLGTGRFGLATFGILFGLIGTFLLRAAYMVNPREARDLGNTVQDIAVHPFGAWFLAILATGLIAYGIFFGLQSYYRHISLSDCS